jgi:hypothetical protein
MPWCHDAICSGAAAVKVTYKNMQRPVLTPREGAQQPKRVVRPLQKMTRPKNLRKNAFWRGF